MALELSVYLHLSDITSLPPYHKLVCGPLALSKPDVKRLSTFVGKQVWQLIVNIEASTRPLLDHHGVDLGAATWVAGGGSSDQENHVRVGYLVIKRITSGTSGN